MDEENTEDVVSINLFGIGGSPKKKEAEVEGNPNLSQGQPSNGGSENSAIDKTENIDDTQAVIPTAITPGSSNANGPLPTPPKANLGEKVDTSKLDAELAKMKPNTSQNVPKSSPANNLATNANDTGITNDPHETDDKTKNVTDASHENTDETEVSEDGDAENDDHEKSDDSVAIADTSNEDTAETEVSENDDADDAENVTDASPKAADTSQKDTDNAKNIDKTVTNKTAVTGKLNENADTAKKSDQPDPQFAEKVTRDVHADESAPQTDPISAQPMPPLTAQNIDYQKPNITELEKHPTVEKKTGAHNAIPVEKMPIVLTFETGRQKITLGELEKVKTGYTFECGNPVNTPVTICANDTPIGTGELLDVDGRIGVRIIEFYNK
jgi:flagellar motor switch/type III secretory pathway protein FliN